MVIDRIIRTERINYLWIVLLVIAAKAALSIFPLDHPMVQDPLLGWSSIGIITSLGFITLYLAKYAGFYEQRDTFSPKVGILISISLGIVTGLMIIGNSVFLEFPNIHIPLPHSVPTYFIAGSLLEIKLHLIPLVLGTWLFSYIFCKTNFNAKVFWVVAILTCVYEPYNQVVAMTSMGMINGLWLQIAMAVFVFITNIIPFVLFKKYGFLPFILYRFTDYFLWHFIWPLIYFT